ncbi:uncharacterized protein PB18E9.04c-like [Pyrus x bretschneideri]|uniref:uncharacterized protein PB18E9.04c-like n=1 Tax=Pyrus x bretschneideri TaxID=225117 RepID=UPI002030F64C|nr:uncharacterized protein PB18E9.04c-like [Pyrus x bretschneideri]
MESAKRPHRIRARAGDSEAEAGPEVDKQTPRQARATVMESSESEPEERPTPQLALPGPRAKVGAPAPLIGQNSSPISLTPVFLTPTPSIVLTPTRQFNPRTREMLHYVKDDSTSANQLPPTTFREPIVPEIPVVSEVTSSQASQATSWASPSASSKATARTEVPFPSIKVPSQASSKGSGNSHPPSASKVDPPQPSKATSPPLLLPEAPSSTQALVMVQASFSSP